MEKNGDWDFLFEEIRTSGQLPAFALDQFSLVLSTDEVAACNVANMTQQKLYITQQESYKKRLRDALAKPGGATVVLGTGVSAALSGNHPVATWKGLLHAGLDWYESGNPEMADNVQHFRDVLNNSKNPPNTEMLVAIAQFVGGQFREAGGGQYQKWLDEQIGNLKVTENNKLVDALPHVTRIMTTNYDDLWKASYKNRESITWCTLGAHEKFVSDPEKYVFHLHGSFSDQASVVLTGEDYGRLREVAVSQELLRELARQSSLVMIGYGKGLDDPNFSELIKWLRFAQVTSTKTHYTLVTDDGLSKFSSQHSGLVAVSYGETYDDLGPFLKEIAPRRESPAGSERRSCEHPPALPKGQQRSVLPSRSTGFNINPQRDKENDASWTRYADIHVRLHDDRPMGSDRFAYLIPSGIAPLSLHDPAHWLPGNPERKMKFSEDWCKLNKGKILRGYVFDMITADGRKKTRIYCDDYDRYLTEQDKEYPE
ncbi:SIR2 family protein [Nocardia sp. KC 131]|uniref:SIR2 family protein n=1 Tax=Nocardia arseniciresistens TaxID=3392119 RepID=UPI00398F0032